MLSQRIVSICAVATLLASTAIAQVTSLGITNSGPAANGSTSAVAYDDKHDVLLHVWFDNGTIAGRFIRSDGTPAGRSR
jgi:hypothetical protein